jgi:hypothetical protein
MAKWQGTLQFMAREVLVTIQGGKTVERTAAHYMDSFINLLSYAVLAHLDETVSDEKAITHVKACYRSAFGHLTIPHITESRCEAHGGALVWTFLPDTLDLLQPRYISKPLGMLLYQLQMLVAITSPLERWRRRAAAYYGEDVEASSDNLSATMIHGIIISFVNRTIEALVELGALILSSISYSKFIKASLGTEALYLHACDDQVLV